MTAHVCGTRRQTVADDAPYGEDIQWVEVTPTKTWLTCRTQKRTRRKRSEPGGTQKRAAGTRRDRTPLDLDRWLALPDIPKLLPGEDRNFGQGLFVRSGPEQLLVH